MATANAGGSASSGVHYPFNYKPKYPEDWKRLGSPDDGYADPAYWTRVEFMHWVRKPAVSASAAMDAWFRGVTIADCASVATASQVNALRAALGDTKFDRLFGGEGKKPIEGPDGKRISLEIGQGVGSSVVADLMRATESAKDAGTPGKRNVQPGEWHYFANHPAYPKKHPTGFWQGENALFKGDEGGVQIWTGFGATYSEDGMNKVLVEEYKHTAYGGGHRQAKAPLRQARCGRRQLAGRRQEVPRRIPRRDQCTADARRRRRLPGERRQGARSGEGRCPQEPS